MSIIIKSPLPGTFYRTPSPDKPSYKEIGDQVAVGDVVGIVEVMKSFHEVIADQAGVVTSIPAEHKASVQVGTTLFELD